MSNLNEQNLGTIENIAENEIMTQSEIQNEETVAEAILSEEELERLTAPEAAPADAPLPATILEEPKEVIQEEAEAQIPPPAVEVISNHIIPVAEESELPPASPQAQENVASLYNLFHPAEMKEEAVPSLYNMFHPEPKEEKEEVPVSGRPQTAKGRDKLPLESEILAVLPTDPMLGMSNGDIRKALQMRTGHYKTHLHGTMQKLALAGKVKFWTEQGGNKANRYYKEEVKETGTSS